MLELRIGLLILAVAIYFIAMK